MAARCFPQSSPTVLVNPQFWFAASKMLSPAEEPRRRPPFHTLEGPGDGEPAIRPKRHRLDVDVDRQVWAMAADAVAFGRRQGSHTQKPFFFLRSPFSLRNKVAYSLHCWSVDHANE